MALRPFPPPLLAAAALTAILVAFAPAASARPVELDVTAFDDGGRFEFRVAGLDGPNPDLGLAPGDEVSIVLRNEGTTLHNLVFGAPISAAVPCCIEPGATARLSFTVPADAKGVEYWCEPHRDTLGMRGVAVAGPEPKGAAGVPLAALAAGLLGAAMLRRPPPGKRV